MKVVVAGGAGTIGSAGVDAFIPRHSMTGDNGAEFSEYQKIAEQLGIDFYFTHPYSSWEEGTNEDTNGFIRQYFSKGTDFVNIAESALREVEAALNNGQKNGYTTKHQKKFLV